MGIFDVGVTLGVTVWGYIFLSLGLHFARKLVLIEGGYIHIIFVKKGVF